jgi:hypothetical protein
MKRNEPVLKTSEEWSKSYAYTVLDPDGWDRNNYQYSWSEELITFKEFEERIMRSTCIFNGREIN